LNPTIALGMLKGSSPEFEEITSNVEQVLHEKGWNVLRFLAEGKGDSLLWPYWQVQIVLGLDAKNTSPEKPILKFFYSPRTTTESLALIATLVKHLNKYDFSYALAGTIEYLWHFSYRKLLNASAIPTVIIEFNSLKLTPEISDTLVKWLTTSLLVHFKTDILPEGDTEPLEKEQIQAKIIDNFSGLTEEEKIMFSNGCTQGIDLEVRELAREPDKDDVSLQTTEAKEKKEEEATYTSSITSIEQIVNELYRNDAESTVNNVKATAVKTQDVSLASVEKSITRPPALEAKNSEEIIPMETKRKNLKRRRYPPNPFVSPAGEPLHQFVRYIGELKETQYDNKPLTNRVSRTFNMPIACSTFSDHLLAGQKQPDASYDSFLALKDLAAVINSTTKTFPKPEKE